MSWMKSKPGVLFSGSLHTLAKGEKMEYLLCTKRLCVGKQQPQCDTWELSICGSFCTTLFWRWQRLYANDGNEVKQERHWKLGESVSGSRVVYKDFISLCIYYYYYYFVFFVLQSVYYFSWLLVESWSILFCVAFSCEPPRVIFTWCIRVNTEKKITVGHIARLLEGQDPRCARRILSLCSFVRLSCICQLWHFFFKRNTFLLKTITSNKCLVLIQSVN